MKGTAKPHWPRTKIPIIMRLAPWRKNCHLMGTRLFPSSDDSNNDFSGTLQNQNRENDQQGHHLLQYGGLHFVTSIWIQRITYKGKSAIFFSAMHLKV
jgi:hypothetical protein